MQTFRVILISIFRRNYFICLKNFMNVEKISVNVSQLVFPHSIIMYMSRLLMNVSWRISIKHRLAIATEARVRLDKLENEEKSFV